MLPRNTGMFYAMYGIEWKRFLISGANFERRLRPAKQEMTSHVNEKRKHHGDVMRNESNKNVGIELLVKRCKEKFRIPENLNYYSQEDYRMAERRFIKHTLYDEGSKPG